MNEVAVNPRGVGNRVLEGERLDALGAAGGDEIEKPEIPIDRQCRLTTGVFVSRTTRSGANSESFASNASGESSEAIPSRKKTSCPAFFSIVAAVAGTTGKM